MTYKYLREQRDKLALRKQYSHWYGFSAPRNLHVHNSADILIPLLADRGAFSMTPKDFSMSCVMASGGFSISLPGKQCTLNPMYLLGLINSQLLFWNLRLISNKFRGGWITCTKQYIGTLPIKEIDFSNSIERKYHDRMVNLVEQMLMLNSELITNRTAHEKTNLQRQLDATDRQIDNLVYELYGLSDEEIAIVESD